MDKRLFDDNDWGRGFCLEHQARVRRKKQDSFVYEDLKKFGRARRLTYPFMAEQQTQVAILEIIESNLRWAARCQASGKLKEFNEFVEQNGWIASIMPTPKDSKVGGE